MNTKKLKAYAPKARNQFIEAITKRAAQLGIYEDRIAEVQIEGSAAIIEGRVFTSKQGQQQKRLAKRVNEKGFELFVREISYTWFNRLAAIRYMELHDYLDHGFRVLSHPHSADNLPEILDHASEVIDSLDPEQKYLDKNHIIELQLAGDKEEELYRELLLGQCHRLYNIMPFMFEAIDDATELLLPDNLTKTDSILKGLVNEIPEEDWNDIEVIGWLYQFYISEHKDAVIGKVVKSEDIPAATQLFTPNWIVKYLVQNSLGRQWLATYPESELKGKMEYYIEPAEQSDDVIKQLKAITPTSIDPEQIKVLDPAAGSGHILVEVYEVLREIYLERGYRLREIPELILTKNIYGLDIDDRAAQLAGFALMMKAREDDRRIFERVERGDVELNVYALQSTENLDITDLWKSLDLEGNQQQGTTGGLFDVAEDFVQPTGVYKKYHKLLQTLKSAFLQAKTLGSLIHIDNEYLQELVSLKELLQAKVRGSDPAAKQVATDLLPIVNQAEILAQQYDVVVANPPYMGSKYQTAVVKKYLKDNFKGYDKDLFSAFMVRNLQFAKHYGELGFMTPFVWMFLSSYEQLRKKLVNDEIISTLVQLEYSGFDGATVPICTFTLTKGHIDNFVGSYIRLSEFQGAVNQSPKTLEAINNRKCGWSFETKPDDFNKIPGSPIAYWVSENLKSVYENNVKAGKASKAVVGLQTGDNDQFMRFWYEINQTNFSDKYKNVDETIGSEIKWVPYNKGGSYRKWYGNREYVVNWQNDGHEIRNFKDKKGNLRSRPQNTPFYFKESITWSEITSSWKSFRYNEQGSISDVKGQSAYFNSKNELIFGLCWLNSNVVEFLTKAQNPTLSFQSGDYKNLPMPTMNEVILPLGRSAISLSEDDWNAFEISSRFISSPLLTSKNLTQSFKEYINISLENTNKLKKIEEEINNYFVNRFDIENDISTEVIDEQVTLKVNVKYRYGLAEEGNTRFQSDTICEFLSYSLGCMMGRYSLDLDGLVYARSGNEGFKELVYEGAYQTFSADDDGIIPIASEEWLFDDDAITRFKEFVKTVWGVEHLQENLEFVAESLCLHALKPVKGESANDTIRRYFSKQFYKDHCKTYKKRPIYWLFSSGKEKAFECLVYLHRYNEGTLSRMRTEYVTPLMGKYDAQHSLLTEQKIEATTTEVRRIEKELKALAKKQAELRTFDEQLKHYAEKRITLDLDDGVKVNYGKFGNLLADVKAIHGKAVK